jgi:hypothetical protein
VGHLRVDLREVGGADLDVLWDTERDEPRGIDGLPEEGVEHAGLTRCLGAYQ